LCKRGLLSRKNIFAENPLNDHPIFYTLQGGIGNGMNDYQTEQLETLDLVRSAMLRLHPADQEDLKKKTGPYLEFRQKVDRFLVDYLGPHCTQSCFENRLSACCSKDGIVTFWADLVINMLVSSPVQLADWALALSRPAYEHKCTYLGSAGCRWHVRPLMCAMFLCDPVKTSVFNAHKELHDQWESLQAAAKAFRWPDKPVLFDWLELFFIERGVHSPLMYINKSPGLMRIKQKAGLF
jgi:hypothetical protein